MYVRVVAASRDKSNIIIPQHNSLVEAAPPSSYLTGGRGKVDAEVSILEQSSLNWYRPVGYMCAVL